MRVRATEGECRPGERAGRVPCGPDHPSGEGKGHRGSVARPGERAGRGIPHGRGPPCVGGDLDFAFELCVRGYKGLPALP